MKGIKGRAPTVSKVVSSTATQTLPDPGPSAPGAVVPTPPKAWKTAVVGRGKGARARAGQFSNAAGAAKEIASSATYAQDFGPHAPEPALLAHLMAGASAWRGQWASASRWTEYCSAQKAAWWAATLNAMAVFQPAFDFAVARDPSVAERYASLTQLMQASSAIAKRGAAVRKAAKAKKAKEAKGTKAPPAAEAAPAETPARAAAEAPPETATAAAE